MKLRIAPFLLAALLCGCGKTAPAPAPKPAAAERSAAPQLDPVPHQRDADDSARFLAGLPGKPGSPFLELESTEAWQEHRKLLDEAWSKADEALLQGLGEFQKKELNGPPFDRSILFYPFGGPDALTATVCFPRSPIYVLVALEPAGTFPTAAQMQKKTKLAPYLAGIRETVASELGRSFFVTREMDRQLRGQVTDGVLIPILHLLVRTNHTILGYRYTRLDEKGQVEERPANVPVNGAFPNKGVEIDFQSDADQSVHQLRYFRVNLADPQVRGNKGFHQYVASLKGATTLLKATSYMTHHPEFSLIRGLVLDNSGAILQDDSGIPYKLFKSDVWNVQLYGDYTKPYGSFQWLEQPDLRKAYKAGGAKPLSMHVGYGFQKITSNLLLARRTASNP